MLPQYPIAEFLANSLHAGGHVQALTIPLQLITVILVVPVLTGFLEHLGKLYLVAEVARCHEHCPWVPELQSVPVHFQKLTSGVLLVAGHQIQHGGAYLPLANTLVPKQPTPLLRGPFLLVATLDQTTDGILTPRGSPHLPRVIEELRYLRPPCVHPHLVIAGVPLHGEQAESTLIDPGPNLRGHLKLRHLAGKPGWGPVIVSPVTVVFLRCLLHYSRVISNHEPHVLPLLLFRSLLHLYFRVAVDKKFCPLSIINQAFNGLP